MFGGQDDNTAAANAGSTPNGTLNGVNDLADGPAAPETHGSDAGHPDGFMNSPSEPAQPDTPAPDHDASATDSPAPQAGMADGNDDLLDLKQQALQQLTPLVGHLEQSPEDKFRTTMMLIQASDNQALLKDAYDAAQAIGDEKVRAQALLDVINEINYFTQNKHQD